MPGLKLIAELGGDGRGFEKMMGSANSMVSGLAGKLSGLFSIGAITAFTKSTLDWAGSLQDVADGLEVNVEWFQKMANGAALAGGKMEDLQKFIADITKSRGESVAGGQTGAKNTAAFKRLGFSEADIARLNTEQFFQKLIDRFKSGMDAQGLNDLREVGGKSARTLAAAFATQFASDAPVLSADLVAQLDQAGDALTDMATMLKVTFAPVIVFLSNLLGYIPLQLKNVATAFGGMTAVMLQSVIGMAKVTAKLAVGNLPGAIREGRSLRHDLGQTAQSTMDELMDNADVFLKNKSARDKALKALLESRAEASKRGPNFAPMELPLVKEGRISAPKPREIDQFTARGELFNRGGNLVNVIANQQLETAKQQLEQAKQMNSKLDRLVNAKSNNGLTIPLIR